MEEGSGAYTVERGWTLSMSEAWATARGHVGIHGMYYYLRPCWCSWSVLPPGIHISGLILLQPIARCWLSWSPWRPKLLPMPMQLPVVCAAAWSHAWCLWFMLPPRAVFKSWWSQGPGWCSWPVLPLTVMWMSVAGGVARYYVEVHELCSCWLSRTKKLFFCSGTDDCRLIAEKVRYRRVWVTTLSQSHNLKQEPTEKKLLKLWLRMMTCTLSVLYINTITKFKKGEDM